MSLRRALAFSLTFLSDNIDIQGGGDVGGIGGGGTAGFLTPVAVP